MTGHLILIGAPRELHIPVLAIAHSKYSRDVAEVAFRNIADIAKFSGRKCLAWILARSDADGIRLIETRNYIPLQTAFYATWLCFESEATSKEFLEAFPSQNCYFLLEKLQSEAREAEVDIKYRLERGDFDLGRVGQDQQRENLARSYIKMATDIRELRQQSKLLQCALALQGEWQQKISRLPLK